MADNRMWLKNRSTGAQVLIAKWFASNGRWVVFHDDLAEKIEALFKDDDVGGQAFGIGGNDWMVEYEVTLEEVGIKPNAPEGSTGAS